MMDAVRVKEAAVRDKAEDVCPSKAAAGPSKGAAIRVCVHRARDVFPSQDLFGDRIAARMDLIMDMGAIQDGETVRA